MNPLTSSASGHGAGMTKAEAAAPIRCSSDKRTVGQRRSFWRCSLSQLVSWATCTRDEVWDIHTGIVQWANSPRSRTTMVSSGTSRTIMRFLIGPSRYLLETFLDSTARKEDQAALQTHTAASTPRPFNYTWSRDLPACGTARLGWGKRARGDGEQVRKGARSCSLLFSGFSLSN